MNTNRSETRLSQTHLGSSSCVLVEQLRVGIPILVNYKLQHSKRFYGYQFTIE